MLYYNFNKNTRHKIKKAMRVGVEVYKDTEFDVKNLYKFIKYKPEIQYLNRIFNINFDNKYLTREQIKKILKY